MNLKMSFLATLSVALLAVTANAEIIIHESDFEAEPAVGFGLMADTMPVSYTHLTLPTIYSV